MSGSSSPRGGRTVSLVGRTTPETVATPMHRSVGARFERFPVRVQLCSKKRPSATESASQPSMSAPQAGQTWLPLALFFVPVHPHSGHRRRFDIRFDHSVPSS
ncbi:hypothetical protein [Haladaptatus halobius]|uniref:hypothetical protein n=1 Tax=Haladaptatus halobius TaxID=2884875 RepID=UPI001D09C0DF|nr:hypothetical protein [Haladaptatus halobius]